MKLIILLTILLPFNVLADDAFAEFDATHNNLNETMISWHAVGDLQASCNSESHKRGGKGFNYSLQGCSFWGKRNGRNYCDIYTPSAVDLETLGHEVRHCFQGEFH